MLWSKDVGIAPEEQGVLELENPTGIDILDDVVRDVASGIWSVTMMVVGTILSKTTVGTDGVSVTRMVSVGSGPLIVTVDTKVAVSPGSTSVYKTVIVDCGGADFVRVIMSKTVVGPFIGPPSTGTTEYAALGRRIGSG